jgi:small subunit ribosomal protein S25e
MATQKWSKGKNREKVANKVFLDEDTYNRLLSEVPKVALDVCPQIESNVSVM